MKLVLDEPAAQAVRERFRQTQDALEKERLRAVMLAMTGTHTHLEIAAKLGRALSTVRDWLSRMQAGGLEGLLRDKPKSGRPSALKKPALQKALRKGLREGRWLTAAKNAQRKHVAIRSSTMLRRGGGFYIVAPARWLICSRSCSATAARM